MESIEIIKPKLFYFIKVSCFSLVEMVDFNSPEFEVFRIFVLQEVLRLRLFIPIQNANQVWNVRNSSRTETPFPQPAFVMKLQRIKLGDGQGAGYQEKVLDSGQWCQVPGTHAYVFIRNVLCSVKRSVFCLGAEL